MPDRGVWYALEHDPTLLNGSDKSESMQTILDEAATMGVHTLELPGIVAIGSPLVLPDGVVVRGGRYGGFGLLPDSNCDMLHINPFAYYGGLDGVALYANKATQAPGDFHHAIRADPHLGGVPWSATTAYAVGDKVHLGQPTDNHHWVCTTAHTNKPPPNTTYWKLTARDACFQWSQVTIHEPSGHGFYAANSSAHRLRGVYAHHCGGYGIWSSYDTQHSDCLTGFNGLAGIFGFATSQYGGCKSYNNGYAAWWNGSAVPYNSAASYAIGDGVVSGGVVYVANDAIPAGAGDPAAVTDGTWIKLGPRQGFVYSSNVSTSDLAVSTAAYYMTVNPITQPFAASGADCVAIGAGDVRHALPNGPGFHFWGNWSHELAASALDAQQNAGSSYYVEDSTWGGSVLQGTSQQPNCIPTSGVNRTKNPNKNAALTLDNTKGWAATIGASRMNAGDDRYGGGIQNADAVPVLHVTGGATLNDVTVVTDRSGVVPSPTSIGAGNRVAYNGRPISRVGSVVSSALPAFNTDKVEVISVTALAVSITSFSTNLTGTPNDGDELTVRITDNGTARTVVWGAKFEPSTVALPTVTVAAKLLTVGFQWNSKTAKWRCVTVA